MNAFAITKEYIDLVALKTNAMPRKIFGFKTPLEDPSTNILDTITIKLIGDRVKPAGGLKNKIFKMKSSGVAFHC
jgi:hypothetical protein